MDKIDLLTCIPDPLSIEEDVFEFWVTGYTVEHTVENRLKTDITIGSYDRVVVDIDTRDQFQTFELLEGLLKKPQSFRPSPVANVPNGGDNLIQLYYSLDPEVARELVGKGRKITAKFRKDLDSIYEKTGIPLKSVLRQYDNIRRIYREVDEKEGKVAVNIQRYYGLSQSLCQQYAAIIFLLDNRIDVSPRKLPSLRYPALVKCVTVIMSEWGDGVSDMGVDRSFLKELHSLKDRISDAVLQTVFSHVNEVMRVAHPEFPKSLCIEAKRVLTRLMGIGYSLLHTKDFTDIFVDLDEFVVSPWCTTGLSPHHLEITLATALSSYSSIAPTKGLTPTLSTFEKYLRTISTCLLVMTNSRNNHHIG